MKIISKFHDYYDSVLVHGQDELHVFQRTPHRIAVNDLKSELSFLIPEIKVSRYPYPIFGRRDNPEIHYFFRPFIIAFCGKIYHGIGIDKYQEKKRTADTLYVYSFEEYMSYCNSNKVFHERDAQFLPYMQSYYKLSSSASNVKAVQCWLEKQGDNKHFEQLIKENIAIAVCHDGAIEREEPLPQYRDVDTYCVDINCSLQSFAFYKLIDAYTAFQELEMYISGTMPAKEKAMISVDDKSLMQKKGFDKYSFKKRQGIKK